MYHRYWHWTQIDILEKLEKIYIYNIRYTYILAWNNSLTTYWRHTLSPLLIISIDAYSSWTSLCCSEHKIRFSLSSWLSIFTSDIKKLPYIDFASGPMNHQLVMRGSPQARGFPSWGVGCPYLSPAGGFVVKLLTCYKKSYIYISRDLINNW